MISYDLSCSAAHRFEGWFGSSCDYQQQLDQGLVQCPVCGSSDITKLLSAPNIPRKGNQMVPASAKHSASANTPVAMQDDAPDSAAPNSDAVMTNAPPPSEAVVKMVRKLAEAQNKILKDSQYVGRQFAEEARAIHYGETKQRQIHGETSPKEAEALVEEGVGVAPLPLPYVPPTAKN